MLIFTLEDGPADSFAKIAAGHVGELLIAKLQRVLQDGAVR